MTRWPSPALLVFTLVLAFAAPAAAQFRWPVPDGLGPSRPRRSGPVFPTPASLDDVPRHVVSTNPTAWLLTLPTVEYELRTVPLLAVGASYSKSLWAIGHVTTNREVLARLYPAGMAFNGPMIGVRLGASHVSDLGDFGAWAFEGGYTATPGKHAYVSITGGLRHLNGFPVNNTGEFQPIVRMNIGLGF